MVIENIDFASGNWRRSRAPHHVKRFLREADTSVLKQFLKFVTGTPNLPFGGLSDAPSIAMMNANGAVAGGFNSKITLTRLPKSKRLPEAHTCFNEIDLPDYNDYEMLKAKLMQALSGDDGGFGNM